MKTSWAGAKGSPATLLFQAVILLAVLINGCDGRRNYLKDSRFDGPGPVSSAWSLEGGGEIRKTAEGALLYSDGDSAPFLFQGVSSGRFGKQRVFTLSAWVYSDAPDSAYLEFSNRRGIDIRSDPHPGDASWRLMKLTARAPEDSAYAEFRIRLYKAGSLTIREASLSPGSASTLEGRPPSAVNLGANTAKWAAAAALAASAIAAAFAFRKYRDNAGARVLEACVLLVILSNMMLVLGKSSNASATSGAAWGTVSVWLIYRASKTLLKAKDTKKAFTLRTLAISLAALSAAGAAGTVYALKNGDHKAAGKAAGFSFILFLASALALTAERLLLSWRTRAKEAAKAAGKTATGWEGHPLETAEAGNKSDGAF